MLNSRLRKIKNKDFYQKNSFTSKIDDVLLRDSILSLLGLEDYM